MWDGRFWVPLRPDNPLDQLPPPVVRRFESEPLLERRGFGPGGVILAAIMGVVLTYMPIPLPAPGSIEGALNEMAIAQTIRGLVTFVALVMILSIGRVRSLRPQLGIFNRGSKRVSG